MAVALTTKSGQTVLVSEDRVAAWEARGYERADKPKASEDVKKAPAKKAAAKKSKK